MIDAGELLKLLIKNKIDFYTGIPDSLLKNFNQVIEKYVKKQNHIISSNEGGSIALAIGYYISTSKLPLVYLQNSGLGNALNPIISLADEKIYSIPMILMIGWRGHPKEVDEPQHLKQGLITIDLLKILKIETIILDKNSEIRNSRNDIIRLINKAKLQKKIVAIIIKKGTFKDPTQIEKNRKTKIHRNYENREKYIDIILNKITEKYFIISTTGLTSRELYASRKKLKYNHGNDFLVIGGMGHANQIATSIALFSKNKKVICLDGDGSLIMHLGSLAICGQLKLDNFILLVFNNGSHLSVGGQKTAASNFSFKNIAKVIGFKKTYTVKSTNSFKNLFNKIKIMKSKVFIEVLVNNDFKKDIGRPKEHPKTLLKQFMDNIQN